MNNVNKRTSDRPRRLAFTGLAGLAVTALLVAACSSGAGTAADGRAPWESSYKAIVAAAEKEKPVRYCQGLDDEENAVMLKDFYAMYPKVPKPEISACNGTEQKERILTEWGSGRTTVDLMSAGNDNIDRIDKEDLSAVPDWSIFDNSPLKIDPKFIGYKGRVLGVGSWSNAIVFNTKLTTAAEVPHDFKDCADPKYNGKFLMDVRPQGFTAFYSYWGEQNLKAWAAGVKANDPLWTRGSSSGLASLAQGERAFECGMQIHGLFRGSSTVDEVDPLLDYVFPKVTNAPFYITVTVAKEPRSPNAAILLAAWLASKGQDAIAKANPGYGSPYVKGTWKQKTFAEQGVTIADKDPWSSSADASKAYSVILESWGFPQTAAGEK